MITYTNEFIDKLENEIENNKDKIFDDNATLDRVAKLMGIYANARFAQAQGMQLEMIQQSKEILKNTDMSKLDLKGLFTMLKGS